MVDNTLGQDFIPPYQQMKLRIDTLTPNHNGKELLKTYLATNDSVPSSNQGILLIGNRSDEVLGRIEASGMTDFFPGWVATYTLSEAEEEEDEEEETEEEDPRYGFGFRPVADSIFIDLIVTDVIGDNSVAQKFNIYELRDTLRRDSMYYFSTPIEELADENDPLFSFTIEEGVVTRSMLRLRLEPTASGLDFMRRIVETDEKVYEKPLYEFHKLFRGLYIAPAPDSPEAAAIYQIYLRQVNADDPDDEYTGLNLWAHNHDENNPTQVKDTIWSAFRFTDTNISWYPNPSLNINRTKFTYPPQIAGQINDTLKTDPGLEVIYAQSLGGVASYLRFTDGMLEQLEALKTRDGVEYSDMVINDARIYFPMADKTVENMNAAPARLGMYRTYGQPYPEIADSYNIYWYTSPYYYVTRFFGPIPMDDYEYYAENERNSTYKSPYGGYINRTKGYYQMSITHHMTRLMTDPDNAPREIWLGPEINTRSTDYSQVALNGSEAEENPIRIVITYTLIK